MAQVQKMLGFGCALWLGVGLLLPFCQLLPMSGGSTPGMALSHQAAAMTAPG